MRHVWGAGGYQGHYRETSLTRLALRDGLGHVRALMTSGRTVTDRYVFDAYGNDVAPGLHNTTEGNALKFRWNGSYGYRTLYLLTGQQSTNTATIMHVGARHYSPSLRRWLQRDPSELDGGDPNLYVYCANNPVSAIDVGGQFTFFVHGTSSSTGKWSRAFMSAAKRWCGEKTGHINYGWFSWWFDYDFLRVAGENLGKSIEEVWKKYGETEPIYIFAHSNGGNVALIASQYLAQRGYKVGSIAVIAFGTPWEYIFASSLRPSDLVERVYNVYSRADAIQWSFGNRVPGWAKDSSDCAWTDIVYEGKGAPGHRKLGVPRDIENLPPFKWRD